jgi:glycosyltransferase involved in cell wall biosynthesis
MKILIIQDYLRSGGTERHSVFMATAFAKAGHEVTLLTFRPRGILELDAEQQPFAFRSLQSFDTGFDWFAPGLLNAAKEAAPDLVLCMGRMANCYAGFIQSRLPRAAVICTMRTGKLLPYLFVRSLKLCRHIIANSHVAKRVLTDDHDIPSHKVTVIHNSVLRFTDETAPRNNALRRYHGANPTTVVLLNVAMFRPEKNQRELIELCAKLPGYLDWQLWLAGDGPARKGCQRLAHDLGLGSRVKFLGYTSDPTPLYHASDPGCPASQSESLSNFLIEAQLHGLPARVHPPARRPAEQPQGLRPRSAPGPLHRGHGPERRRQVLARLRHAPRRGPAALRRDLQRLHPAVPRPARQAQGRLASRTSGRRSPSSRPTRSRRRAPPSAR